MMVHFVDSGLDQDMGLKEVNVEAFKMDADDAPYAIVSNPFRPGDSLRAEYNYHNGCLQWVVDVS
jgi:hypothetical protein